MNNKQFTNNYVEYPLLCGFSYYELIDLRCDLFEAGILNKWSSPYKDKARIYLRRCLGLPDKWEGEDDTKDNN